MAASIIRLNKLTFSSNMCYSFIETSLRIRFHFHKVKFKFATMTNVKNFATSSDNLRISPQVTNSAVKPYPSACTEIGKKQKFDEMVAFHKKEARASVVIQVGNPSKSVVLVNQVCSRHGNVKNIFHYTNKDKELLLLELDSETSVLSLLSSCSHNNSVKVIPAASPFLWLRAMSTEVTQPLSTDTQPLVITENLTKNDDLEELLSNSDSISHQILILEDQTRLSEIGKRLRWITCVQIERMLSGLFPNLQVLPFGSFVNGCGRNGCDLDMAISLDGHFGPEKVNTQFPLIFQAKPAINNPRLQTQRLIEVFADILQNFTTGCTQVQRILQARVPIVKFYHEFTGIDCDVSVGSLTGVFMSELLYLFGEIDWRFRPLVTAVRHWAAWARLTDIVPSPRITNFTLTLLVVFYLQRCTPAILPTLDELIKLARPHVDARQTNDVDCTFLRDPSLFPERSKLNQATLEDLFIGFLRFVESFDFNDRSISVITGNASRKLDSKPLYVQNPLERELNVSRNVNLKELTRVVMEARNSLYIIETREHQTPGNWGLLSLPRAEKVRRINQKSTNANYLSQLDIKDLFLSHSEESVDCQKVKSEQVEQSSPITTSSESNLFVSEPKQVIESRAISSLGGLNNPMKNTSQQSETPKNVRLRSVKTTKRVEKQKRK